jgi:hypothetical protein
MDSVDLAIVLAAVLGIVLILLAYFSKAKEEKKKGQCCLLGSLHFFELELPNGIRVASVRSAVVL